MTQKLRKVRGRPWSVTKCSICGHPMIWVGEPMHPACDDRHPENAFWGARVDRIPVPSWRPA